MSEKQAYIFFISDSQGEPWHIHREISLFYLNGITVAEEEQCEVLSVVDDDNFLSFSRVDSKIELILYSYQAKVQGISFKWVEIQNNPTKWRPVISQHNVK